VFLCIVVPLPPGANPFTVNNSDDDDDGDSNNNNNNNNNKYFYVNRSCAGRQFYGLF
jgi:hypothetical protein